MRRLHILNGEGTHQPFRLSGLEGGVGVWNEALCQGPAPTTTDATEFQSARLPFLIEHFEASSEQANDLMQSVWTELNRIGEYDEITLWFEFDLFCQANLLYLCHWLWKHPNRPQLVSLVSPKEHPSVPHFRGMGQLAPEAFPELWEKRIQLDAQDLLLGHKAWLLWAHGDLMSLHALDSSQHNWPHLKIAVHAMVQELPNLNQGFARSEQFILQTLRDSPKSPADLFRSFSHELDVLGYGDLQFFQLVAGLAPEYLNLEDQFYHLTDAGKARITAMHATSSPTLNRWVGPCYLDGAQSNLYYDKEQEQVVSGS